MARLPTPGSDVGQWGDILNTFLSVEHNADGTLKKASDIVDAKAKATLAVRSVYGQAPVNGAITYSDDILAFYAANPDNLITGNITRDANGAITAADVKWPDGMIGEYTTLVASETFLGSVDSYKITYNNGAQGKTLTQPVVARDATGAVIHRPAITVGGIS